MSLQIIHFGIRLFSRQVNCLIWLQLSYDKFSTASAWELSRLKGNFFIFYDWIWHKYLSKCMSLITWCAIHGALSIDIRIQFFSIPLVSGCDCCFLHCVESINHVLSTSQVTMDIWEKKYLLWLGFFFCAYKSLFDRTILRFHKAKNNSQFGILIGIIPIVVRGACGFVVVQ